MSGWSDEQLALQEFTREFVRREVEPHLQEWEDAGEIPRSLHLAAGLFNGGIALPHMAAHGTPEQIDSYVRPTRAGEKIGSLAVHAYGVAVRHVSGYEAVTERVETPAPQRRR